jgi:hypothetical protein
MTQFPKFFTQTPHWLTSLVAGLAIANFSAFGSVALATEISAGNLGVAEAQSDLAATTQYATVVIYKADSQCNSLVAEKITIPAERQVEAAVGKVLERRNTGDFDLAGYRVILNANSGIATVDLRISPGSQRTFASLSNCEQMALFGSVRKTLTSNVGWKIQDVRFTAQGEEIYL